MAYLGSGSAAGMCSTSTPMGPRVQACVRCEVGSAISDVVEWKRRNVGSQLLAHPPRAVIVHTILKEHRENELKRPSLAEITSARDVASIERLYSSGRQ